MLPPKHPLQGWISALTTAMALSGRGYRRHSLRHTGRPEKDDEGKMVLDCRKDKLDPNGARLSSLLRRYNARYGT